MSILSIQGVKLLKELTIKMSIPLQNEDKLLNLSVNQSLHGIYMIYWE